LHSFWQGYNVSTSALAATAAPKGRRNILEIEFSESFLHPIKVVGIDLAELRKHTAIILLLDLVEAGVLIDASQAKPSHTNSGVWFRGGGRYEIKPNEQAS